MMWKDVVRAGRGWNLLWKIKNRFNFGEVGFILPRMKALPFEKLPVAKAGSFVPARVFWSEWKEIAPLYDRLEARAAECRTPAELEKWLLDWGELTAALDQDGSERYIAMTCHTDDAEIEKAYLHFVEHIQPEVKPREFKLAQLFVEHPMRGKLLRPRYEVFDRTPAVQVEVFRPENVPVEREEAKLGQQYQKLIGSLTVEFKGKERTLVEMGRFQEEPDRAMRQETWELVAKRRLLEVEAIENIFDELLKLRVQMAKNAGFNNYVDYAFRSRRRFDYGPADCLKFHDAIEQEVMPVLRELQAERRRQLKLAALRPWDLAVDPESRPALRPFEQVERHGGEHAEDIRPVGQIAGGRFPADAGFETAGPGEPQGQGAGRVSIHAGGGAAAVYFHERGRGAAGRGDDFARGGPCVSRAGDARRGPARIPRRAHRVLRGGVHEHGTAGERIHRKFLRGAGGEARARRDHLEGIVEVFPWIATVDAFQHWIYSHPQHTREERRAAWENLMKRFGGDVDWSGWEKSRGYLWHRQLHIFLHPFYYVEYGIAELGALQVWANSRRDKARALEDYKRGLALGGSRPLPELFTAAGCRFDFSAATIKPLIELVRTELGKLG